MQYLKFFFLIVMDIIFSFGTSYLFWSRWIDKINKESSCGTGSMAEAFFARIVTVVVFIISIFLYSFLFHWILFTLI